MFLKPLPDLVKNNLKGHAKFAFYNWYIEVAELAARQGAIVAHETIAMEIHHLLEDQPVGGKVENFADPLRYNLQERLPPYPKIRLTQHKVPSLRSNNRVINGDFI